MCLPLCQNGCLKIQEDLQFFPHICRLAFNTKWLWWKLKKKNNKNRMSSTFPKCLKTWNSWVSTFQLINRIREMVERSGGYEGLGIFFIDALIFGLLFIPCLVLTGVLHSVSLSPPLRLFVFKINNTDSFYKSKW